MDSAFVPQAPGMIPVPQGMPHGMPGVRRMTWQDPIVDRAARQEVTQLIYNIFSKRRPNGAANWGNKLGDFIKRLEEGLYKDASSKEEYMDSTTLETRLQDVAKRLTGNKNQMAQQGGGQAQPYGYGAGPGIQLQSSLPALQGNGTGMPQYQPNAHSSNLMPTPGLGAGFVPNNMDNGVGPSVLRQGLGGNGPNGAMSSPVLPADVGVGNLGPQGPGVPGMLPNNGFNSLGTGLMPNGAPVLIRGGAQRDTYNVPSGMQGMGGNSQRMPFNGMGPPPMGMNSMSMGPPGPQGPGFVPTGMVPVNSMAPGPSAPAPTPSGMVPVPGSMVPTPIPPLPANSFPGGMPNALPHAMPPGPMGMSGHQQQPQQQVLDGHSGGADSEMATRQYVQKQQRWLLFLRHCAKCREPDNECQLKQQCKFGKQLWQHILNCANVNCEYPRCTSSKDLLKHHQKCKKEDCPICAPVKDYVRRTRQHHAQAQAQAKQMVTMMPGLPPMMNTGMPTLPSMPMDALAPAPSLGLGQKRTHSMMGAGPLPSSSGMNMGDGMMPMPAAPMSFVPVAGDEQMSKRPRREDILKQNTGLSLLETFSRLQISSHIELVRNAQAAVRSQQPPCENPASDLCKVCGCNRLLFEPPVLYCSMCALRIKRTQTYYYTQIDLNGNDVKGCWCHSCFTEAKDGKVMLEGQSVPKANLQKRKNDEEIEESWVECDHCGGWVHQICGLFNKGQNRTETHYLCPDCLMLGMDAMQRHPVEERPQSMLESKDLSQCQLTQFLEQRLQKALEQERLCRAAKENKMMHEVPTAEGLCIRIVNSNVKKCEVKPRFLDTFGQAEDYPTEFPYRQRVMLLFQNLDGVDVCLFCMYVQEYGEDCPKPNKNCVYLSYLDSVKYFKPEVAAVIPSAPHTQNVALRTFVYHQILIGYLDYVRMLGFEQMYIWACPPMPGDDYILYCHPQRQKTPRSDRLRQWYLDMLKLAKAEGIVGHVTTLWDTYFEGGRDHRMEKCSVAHIPYLEGDYWPGEAEILLNAMADGQRQASKKGSAALAVGGGRNAKGKRYGTGPASTDEQLMSRLGEILGGNMKEDFIVAHLFDVCTFCRTHIHGGQMLYRFRAAAGMAPKAAAERKFEGIKLEQGPNIPAGPVTSLTVCEGCFRDEEMRHAGGAKTRLPAGVTPMDLIPEKVEPSMRAQDNDPNIESDFFETRQAFLSLCQGNHYQFDTLRRAKHSSMMVLYHLHNPQAPAFVSSCNVCNLEMEPGSGFRCTVCSDFDICQNCQKTTGHPHPLQPQSTRKYDETRMRLTDAERRERNETMQRTMALLLHACSCDGNCASNSCRKVRSLFAHAATCQLKIPGNCPNCKKIWFLLHMHAKSCTRNDCKVPRCRELKEMRRRQAARQDEQRRMAYQAMMRQQHAASMQPQPL